MANCDDEGVKIPGITWLLFVHNALQFSRQYNAIMFHPSKKKISIGGGQYLVYSILWVKILHLIFLLHFQYHFLILNVGRELVNRLNVVAM